MSNRQLIIFHIILGFLLTLGPIPKLYGALIVFIALYKIVSNSNSNDEALLFSGYLIGSEVLLRMTQGFVLYEIGKYGTIVFLFVGALVGKNYVQRWNVNFIFYILLLLLGIVFTNTPAGESLRKAVAFNLSGPFLVGVCALYCYSRRITVSTLYKVLKYMVYPIVTMSVYLYLRTPDLSEIKFGGVANFAASGGFGPNQVSTVLGLGMLIIAILMLTKNYLTGYVYLDALLLLYISYRGLLTFSRGGVVTGVVCILAFGFFYALSQKNGFLNFAKLGIGAAAISIAVWAYTASATGGMLNNRYLNQTAAGNTKEDVTSGRADILLLQFNNFINNPITGIGVGNGRYFREGIKGKKVTAASHNEIGRLLEEHGLIGFFSLLLLVFTPISLFRKNGAVQNAFLTTFFIMWLFTIGHSAMRIALPSLAYGLSLIRLVKDDE